MSSRQRILDVSDTFETPTVKISVVARGVHSFGMEVGRFGALPTRNWSAQGQRRSVMRKQAQIKNPTHRQNIRLSRLTETRRMVEDDLNLRLNELSGLVDKLGTDPYYIGVENRVQKA